MIDTGKLKKNIPLAPLTTIQIGGNAMYYIEVERTNDLINAVKSAAKEHMPFVILGGGSNTLILDEGYDGLIIRNKTAGIKLIGFRGSFEKNTPKLKDVYLEVDSGVLINRLVRYTLDEGFEGLENFFQQPGTVGGAVYINAHNMQKKDFFGDHVYEAKILTPEGKEKKVDASYFDFGYDESKIQKTHDIVLSVILKLKKVNKETLWKNATEQAHYRRLSQPQGVRSLGCIFRNIEKSESFRLHTPSYTQSAGFLIDSTGLKGYKIGKAYFSKKHANFIVHEGGATSSDVLQLIALAKDKVKAKFGVALKEEIVIVGK